MKREKPIRGTVGNERADRIIHVRDGLVFDDSGPPIGHQASVEVLG